QDDDDLAILWDDTVVDDPAQQDRCGHPEGRHHDGEDQEESDVGAEGTSVTQDPPGSAGAQPVPAHRPVATEPTDRGPRAQARPHRHVGSPLMPGQSGPGSPGSTGPRPRRAAAAPAPAPGRPPPPRRD